MTTAKKEASKLDLQRVAARYSARRASTPKQLFDNAAAQRELLKIVFVTSESRERANQALGVSTRTIETPSTAPTEAPSETPFEKPDVWNMPTTGIGWGCGCEGEDIEPDFDELLDCAIQNCKEPGWMTHEEVIETAKDFWEYESICPFFRLVMNDAAKAVNGAVAEKYKFNTGVEIVAYFSKVWNGCPEEACEGDY